MKKQLLMVCAVFSFVLSLMVILPAEAYAADIGTGGSNYTNARLLSVGTEYYGTALRKSDGRLYYKFRTTSNKHVGYKLWGINYKNRGGFYEKDNVRVELYDRDGNNINWLRLVSDGSANAITITNLDSNTTYYLKIYSNDYNEDADFALTISQVVDDPGRVYINSVKPGRKKLTVKWAIVPYAEKYQVKYRKKGTSKWKTKITENSKITLKKLKKGKKYQVKVRAIRVVDGRNYPGAYSKITTKRVK